MDTITTTLSSIERKVDKQTATAGGGCYYTVYTSKPYLNGYKLKLSDGTSAKSCYIGYDDDSNYWCGVVRVPLANNITIEIIDPDTGLRQGVMSTSAVTTSGYATISLDTLMQRDLANLLDVNDTLATNIYKDSVFTSSDSYVVRCISGVGKYPGHLADFMFSSMGISLQSTGISELLTNDTEFIQVMNCPRNVLFLQDANIGQAIANSRQCLSNIFDNPTVVSLCEGNATFCSYLQNTSIPTITVSKTAGQEHVLNGRLLCLTIQTGCLGYHWQGYDIWQTLPMNHAYSARIFQQKGICVCGDSSYTYNDSVIQINTAKYAADKYATYNICHDEYRYDDSIAYVSSAIGSRVYCNQYNVVIRNKFVNYVNIEPYSSRSADLGVIDSGIPNKYAYPDYVVGTVTTSQSTDSIITYIDLDADV